MMQQRWKRFEIFDHGQRFFQVGRIRDPRRAIHAGNVVWAGWMYHTPAEADEYAARLNAQEAVL